MTIDERLSKKSDAVYSAENQVDHTGINTLLKNSFIKTPFGTIQFNQWKLKGIKNNIKITIANSNWSIYTIGENGIRVTNIFEGIDLELKFSRGSIKSNFIIRENNYAEYESLVFEDEFVSNTDGFFVFANGQNASKGIGELLYKNAAESVLEIGTALIFPMGFEKEKSINAEYTIAENKMGIIIPMTWIIENLSQNTPLIIDPTVTSSNTLAQNQIGGSGYNATCFNGFCSYNLSVPTPANATITDVQWSFNYRAQGGCWLSEGAVTFYYGTCRSPSASNFYWYCNNPSGGTCTGTNLSIINDITSCLPTPSCTPQNLNFTMRFHRCYDSGDCSNSCIGKDSPWTMTITGRTLEYTNATPITLSNTTICQGGTITASTAASFGIPPYTYNWSLNSSMIPSNGSSSSSVFNFPNPGSFTIYSTITDACGTVISSSRNITVTAGPTINASPNPPTICPGQGTGLTLTSTTSNINYSWTSTMNGVGGATNGSGIGSGTNSFLFVYQILTNNTTATGNVIYTITGAVSNGCSNSATVIVTVNANPTINGATTLCINATSQLTGSGTPAISNPWTSSNTGVATVSSTGLVTGIASGTTTITYTNSVGCSTTLTVTISDILDWANLQFPGSGTICEGGTYTIYGQLYNTGVINTPNPGQETGVTVEFGYSSSNTNPTTWTNWSTGNFNTQVGNNDEYMGTFSGLTAGTYYYTFRYQINGCGWQYGGYSSTGGGIWNGTNYISGVLTIIPIPNAGTNGTLTVCTGTTPTNAQLFASLGGTPTTGGTWTNVGLVYTYTVNATSPCTTAATATVTLTQQALPIALITGNLSICSGETTTLTASGGTSYLWSSGLGNTATTSAITTAGTYTVTVTDGSGCTDTESATVVVNPLPTAAITGVLTICSGQSTTLTASGGTSYAWSSGLGNTATTSAITTAGTYSVTVTGGNSCTNTVSAIVVVNSNIVPSFTQISNYCSGEAIPNLLTTSINGITGTWSPAINNTATTTYTFTPSTGLCATIQTMSITITPNITPLFTQVGSYCSGATIPQLSISSTNGISGSWSPAINNTATTTYTFTPTAGQCATTQTMSITIATIITSTNFVDLCDSEVPLFWNGNSYNETGIYTYNTVTAGGCDSIAILDLTINPTPIASFTPSLTSFTESPQAIALTNTSFGAVNYTWDFGDGSFSTDENPSHIFADNSNGQIITLFAESSEGCIGTYQITIELEEELIYYVPNTFTPDGDGYNQTFKPVFTSGFDPYNYEMLIFNRWGDIIFETHDVTYGWDGTYALENCQDGVYLYKITFKNPFLDEPKVVCGSVSLLK